jgi:1-deoxy-D-xylulose-5-phosphate synthase
MGGFGTAVLEFANEAGLKNPVKIFGVPDKFIEQGEISETHQMAGMDFDAIFTFVKSTLDQCG